jgi:15-cis-phytoene synthase
MLFPKDLKGTDSELWDAFRVNSRTFSLAARFLPAEVRMPVATLYYYCRSVDTVADEVAPRDPEDARAQLNLIEQSLHETFEGRAPAGMLWHRLSHVATSFDLDREAMFELIEGARWDLDQKTVETDEDLIHYSELVGGCVGAMMLPFLVSDPEHRRELRPVARSMGVAMQITNILRDVGEDARQLGRVYLPRRRLMTSGIDPGSLADLVPDEYYARLVEDVAVLAEERYRQSLASIDLLPAAYRRGIDLAGRFYREILNEVRAAGYDNIRRRAVVPFKRKVLLVVRDGYERRKAALRAPDAVTA